MKIGKWVSLILTSILISAEAGRDFYSILGIDKKSSIKQIKKAFRKKSIQLHPDRNRDDPKANLKFSELREAYEVLTNDTTRKIYDQYGEEGLENQNRMGGQQHPFMFHGFPFGGFQQGPRRVQWFDDTQVEFIENRNELKNAVDSADETFADLLFLFNGFDGSPDDSVKEIANNIVEFASRAGDTMKVYAINCATMPQTCGLWSRTNRPAELHLMTPSAWSAFNTGVRKQTGAFYVGDNWEYDTILDWVTNSLPPVYTSIKTAAKLNSWLESNGSNKAKVLVFTDEGCSLNLLKLLSRRKKTIDFGSIDLSQMSNSFKLKMEDRLDWQRLTKKKKEILKNDGLGMLHIGNPFSILRETTDWVSLSSSTPAIELTLAKFIAQKNHNSGIYSQSALPVHELTSDSFSKGGECAPSDSSYCFILLENGLSRNNPESESLTRLSEIAMSHRDTSARFVWIDTGKHSQILKHFELSESDASSPGTLVAYRPKRKKFVSIAMGVGNSEVEAFVESVNSGIKISNEGRKIEKLEIL